MKTVSKKEFIKILEKRMMLKKVPGSHFIFSQADKVEVISVPVHKNDDLKKGLQRKLMTIAEINDNEL